MKLNISSVFVYLLGFQLLLMIVSVLGMPWCKVPSKRNWRFPPPPPPPRRPYRPVEKAPLKLVSRIPPPRHLPGRPLIALFQHENHNGLKYEQYVGPRCYNLPNQMNDKASSLNTNGRCVKVCKDRDCKRCTKMYPGSAGHYKLEEIGLDDQITSLQPCGDIYEHV
ncbi:unnamed protein product [Allacma fusca]|uniref:Uncharacterized protein n=1 Tax=Allacma fusca TaxID=39272 RepID=A0A8J2LKK8_9HEXA|nr:unnamed protein product [Allacma fusca]